ncbi:MAG: hypothetical protein ACK5TQ_13400 [Acetobacteraceae bacterium]|jgi:hypothetical protein
MMAVSFGVVEIQGRGDARNARHEGKERDDTAAPRAYCHRHARHGSKIAARPIEVKSDDRSVIACSAVSVKQ